MSNPSIAFVGAGNMAASLIGGLYCLLRLIKINYVLA